MTLGVLDLYVKALQEMPRVLSKGERHGVEFVPSPFSKRERPAQH
jgi:hypothetical protein